MLHLFKTQVKSEQDKAVSPEVSINSGLATKCDLMVRQKQLLSVSTGHNSARKQNVLLSQYDEKIWTDFIPISEMYRECSLHI